MADELKQTSEGSATAPVTDDTKPSSSKAVSSPTPTSTVSRGNKKARDGTHGLKFESKLLPLFCIRGLGAGYKFELGKENEDLAGKFDDVIFRYEVADKTTAGKHWRYLYLQAKHKENAKGKITANHLLDPMGNGQFSLKKYFLSYCKMRVRGDDVRDCIMCTNWGVNEQKFHKIKLEKVADPHDILTFASEEISVNIYKLQIDKVLRKETLKLLGVSDIDALGVTDSFNSDTLEIQFTYREQNAFEDQEFSVDLVMEKVVDSKTKTFHPNFLDDENLSVGAQKFRHKICEVIDDFYSKFILVVDMPNELDFKEIIETEDISKYYQSNQCENQTIRIIDKISSAFEGKPAEFWLTSEEGKKILLAGVTQVSLEYQRQLKENIGFNDSATRNAIQVLKKFIDSPGNNKVQRIFTASPQLTAVKFISAIQNLLQEVKQEGNYLVVRSRLLQDEKEMKRWRNILKSQKGFHHFLVVVCDDEASAQNLENLFVDHQDDKNFGIIISRGEELAEKEEEINFIDLTIEFQNKILSKIVSLFQEEEKTLTVRDLVSDKPEEVIDFRSIEELLSEEKELKIPSFNTSNFELYIKRRLRFPFDGQFELKRECRISPDGQIEWLIEEKERKEVWQKIKDEITNRASSKRKIVDDSDLIEEKSIVIISEVAGSGKSNILSHFYNEIKNMKPDHWVIRINLIDRFEEKKSNKVESLDDAVDFLVNQLHVVVEKSSFSRSLFRNRLETGDRIVFMFDGFDEIDDQCQEKAIQLMKVIIKEKLIPLYVTTRPHMLDKLQFEFSQLAYSLENFTEKDQINFLVSYWKKELNLSQEFILQRFAESLVERVAKTLNDQEKTFFGIPLQSRILALNFQANVSELITTGWTEHEEELLRKETSDLLANQKFDCVSLFERLMEEKSSIFRDKAKVTDNDIQKSAIKREMKAIFDHLTKLAIETLVTDQEITKVLWPPQSLHMSDEDLADEEKDIASNGLKFGLTIKIGDKIQFLHRTIAEYLFALFLYKGFLLDDKQHNKLLENEFIRQFISEEILVKWKYDGVKVFFNVMLKKIVDDDEKWRNTINTRCLPDRLKHFIDSFCSRVMKTCCNYKNALLFSLNTGKIKIFTFLCDCLDSTLDETQIESVMEECFMRNNNGFSFQRFRTTESKVFERFIGYFKNNTFFYWQVLLKLDPFNPNSDVSQYPEENFKFYLKCRSESENFHENGEEHKKTVGILISFIENVFKNYQTLSQRYFSEGKPMFLVIKRVLSFLIFHENYESHLKKLIQVLDPKMDDSQFSELLKGSFHFGKKHFTSGRIEKVLVILCDLKKNQCLIDIRRTVLKIDPKAFQRFYFPVVEGEDLTAMDVNKLTERDSYEMTRLHRAASYGVTEEVDIIFENLSQYQDNETKQVVAEFMIRDKDRVTPFYIAATYGREEIYNKMLAFVKQNLPSCITEKHLTCRHRFELLSLYDAIESENIEMFQIILKAIKKKLRPLELTTVLCRPKEYLGISEYTDENHGMQSIFEWIKNSKPKKEFCNAIVKIAVTRDDGVKDYTDLYDLIVNEEKTIKILRYMDLEDVQGLLKLKGVANFTQQLVNRSVFQIGDYLTNLTGDLLRHFTNDQIEQYVDTIFTKSTPMVEEIQIFSTICNCLKKREVGDDCLKKILLHEDETDFIMTRLQIKDVKRMLTCLSEERLREEVKQEWKNDAPAMRRFFSRTDLELKIVYLRAKYWANILMFYLEFGSKEYLTEFVEIVTDLRKVEGKRCRPSVLSLILEDCDEDTTLEILKLVSEKEEQGILVPDAVKRMMIHKIDEIPFIIKAMLLGKDIDKWLQILTPQIREEIQEFLKLHAPKYIDYAFRTLYFSKRIQTLISFLNYSNEKQLETFVRSSISSSIWDEIPEYYSTKEMNRLMKCVSEKLGSNAVKELILHKKGETPVIFNIADGGKEKVLEVMLNYLSAEDRKEIQRLIDEYLASRRGNKCPCLF